MGNKSQYKCHLCINSYVKNKVRLCEKFTADAVDDRVTNFTHMGFKQTRETGLIWNIGGVDCPDFRV